MSTDAAGATVSKEVVVGSRVGLHARPAGMVVKAAGQQPAIVRISKGDSAPADARSMLSLLAIGAAHGDTVVLTADGDGAAESVAALAELIARDLDSEG